MCRFAIYFHFCIRVQNMQNSYNMYSFHPFPNTSSSVAIRTTQPQCLHTTACRSCCMAKPAYPNFQLLEPIVTSPIPMTHRNPRCTVQ